MAKLRHAWLGSASSEKREASLAAQDRHGLGVVGRPSRAGKAQCRAGDLDYLCFETMAEATVSAAQVRKRRDPHFPGYDTYLDDRMRAVLPACLRRGTQIITNQGWINPEGAARRIVASARARWREGKKIAAVSGSLITERLRSSPRHDPRERQAGRQSIAHDLISAEAYLGAEPIVEALGAGAEIVVTGRVADPSLFLAPMMHEFGWRANDHARLGRAAGSAT